MLIISWTSIILAILLDINVPGVDARNQSQLIADLFSNYHSKVIPRCSNSSDAVHVSIDMVVRQVIELNEPTQILTLNAWMRFKWHDCQLVWNPNDYGGINNLILPYSMIWIPDITLYDNAEDTLKGITEYRALVSYNGAVTYNFPTVVNTLCKIDVTFFPFDRQVCPMEFGSWAFHGLDLNVTSAKELGDTTAFKVNAEWNFEKMPIETKITYYSCCTEPYTSVTFYMTIKRKPLFYVFNLLFPCILITAMAMLGFILPPDAGEKVSLEMTVLLALSVFLLIVSESLPPTSETFPFIGVYFASAMVMVSVSTILTVFVLNFHFKGQYGQPVPAIIRKLFLGRLASIMFVNDYEKTDVVQMLNRQKHVKSNNSINEKTLEAFGKFKYLNGSNGISNGICSKITEEKPKKCWMTDLENGDSVTLPNNNKDEDGRVLPSEPVTNVLSQQLNILKKVEHEIEKREYAEHINSEWQRVAMVMDRLFLALFFFFTIITTLTILLKCIYN